MGNNYSHQELEKNKESVRAAIVEATKASEAARKYTTELASQAGTSWNTTAPVRDAVVEAAEAARKYTTALASQAGTSWNTNTQVRATAEEAAAEARKHTRALATHARTLWNATEPIRAQQERYRIKNKKHQENTVARQNNTHTSGQEQQNFSNTLRLASTMNKQPRGGGGDNETLNYFMYIFIFIIIVIILYRMNTENKLNK